MKSQLFSALAALIVTSACGGSETSLVQFGSSAAPGFDEIVTLSGAYQDQFGNENEPLHRVSTGSAVPVSGSARFTGYITVGAPRLAPSLLDDFEAAAKTTVDVDFDTGAVSSETGQFYNITDQLDLTGVYGSRVAGSVEYALTRSPVDTNLYFGNITGALTRPDGATMDVTAPISGAVMGPDGEGYRVVSVNDIDVDVQVYTLKD